MILDKCKTELRQKEAGHQQQQLLKEPSARTRRYPIRGGSGGNPAAACRSCGKPRHPPSSRCPACSAVCHKCNKKGQTQCFSKTVTATTEEQDNLPFLGMVFDGSVSSWTITIQVGEYLIPFKIDAGAQVTAISERTYNKLHLKKASTTIYRPAQRILSVVGQFTVDLSHGQRRAKQRVYVVKDLQASLLGLPSLTALQLLCRVDAITESSTDDDIIKLFPRVLKASATLVRSI